MKPPSLWVTNMVFPSGPPKVGLVGSFPRKVILRLPPPSGRTAELLHQARLDQLRACSSADRHRHPHRSETEPSQPMPSRSYRLCMERRQPVRGASTVVREPGAAASADRADESRSMSPHEC